MFKRAKLLLPLLLASFSFVHSKVYTLQNNESYSGCLDTHGESFITDNSASTIIKVENWSWSGEIARGAIKFDLSEINSEEKVLSAKISLKIEGGTGLPNPINLFKADAEWDPRAFSRFSNNPDGQTFGEKNSYAIGDVLTWDVTSYVKNVIENSGNNNGFLIVENTALSMVCNFYSSEYEVVEDRPKLEIETEGSSPVTSSKNVKPGVSGIININDHFYSIKVPTGNIKNATLVQLNGKSYKLNKSGNNAFAIDFKVPAGIYLISFKKSEKLNMISQRIVIY